MAEQGAKVVLVGDPEQLQAGAAFRAISDRTSYVELTEIWRQKEIWQKDATVQLAIQKTAEAIVNMRHMTVCMILIPKRMRSRH